MIKVMLETKSHPKMSRFYDEWAKLCSSNSEAIKARLTLLKASSVNRQKPALEVHHANLFSSDHESKSPNKRIFLE